MAGFANWSIEIRGTFIHVPDARDEAFAPTQATTRASSCPPIRLPPGPGDRKLASHAFSSAKSASGRSGQSTRAPSEEAERRAGEGPGLREGDASYVDLDCDEAIFQLTPREAEAARQRWLQPPSSELAWEPPLAWELAPGAFGDGAEAWAPWQLAPEACWDWSSGGEAAAAQPGQHDEYLGEYLGATPASPIDDGFAALEHGWTSPDHSSAPLHLSLAGLAPRTPPAPPPPPTASFRYGGSTDSGYSKASPVADDRFAFASQGSVEGPELTSYHTLHEETHSMGAMTEDCREFTKTRFEGRLSVVTESEIRSGGVHRYLMQFTGGDISSADGVGFIFSTKLPCPKNIQQITSVFVNRGGRICMRSGRNVVRATPAVRRWEVGDYIEVIVNLDELIATFRVWPRSGRAPSVATLDFGAGFAQLGSASAAVERRTGYLAAVVQNLGVTIALRS